MHPRERLGHGDEVALHVPRPRGVAAAAFAPGDFQRLLDKLGVHGLGVLADGLRKPVAVNLALREFVDKAATGPRRKEAVHGYS